MNMGELVKGFATAAGSTESKARDTITLVFEQISEAVARGEEVAIFGFGKFTVKARPEREGRNPATGAPVTIPASRKVSFAASKGLKDRL